MATPNTWLDEVLMKLIQAAGIPVPNRGSLDFRSGFTVTDDPANDVTHVDSAGGVGTIEVGGVAQPSRSILDFASGFSVVVDGTTIHITDTDVDTFAPATTGAAEFGEGIEGALTFDGSSSVAGFSLSGGVYTATQSHRVTNAHIQSTADVHMGGFELFGTGTLTIDAGGALENDGGAGFSSGFQGASANNGVAGVYGDSFTGGVGGSGVANGGNATGGGGLQGLDGTTGTGGAGGGAGAQTGGNGANVIPMGASFGTARYYPQTLTFQKANAAQSIQTIRGGGGGGGGACNTGGQNGGGGGGGGGLLVCTFATIVNNGRITARGGNGGNGSGGAAGGGGGGKGGIVAVHCRAYSGSGVVDANGGIGGTATGGATNGTNGAAGDVIWPTSALPNL